MKCEKCGAKEFEFVSSMSLQRKCKKCGNVKATIEPRLTSEEMANLRENGRDLVDNFRLEHGSFGATPPARDPGKW